MMYPTKTALILIDDLAAWLKVNISAFLTGGLMHGYPDMAGEPYRDNDDNFYLAMIREPVFVYGADALTIRRTYERARSRGMAFSIYTRPLFATSNDADNRASVAATPAAELDIVGLGLHGERKLIDKVVNGLRFLA
ncbi:DUF2000 family protein [Aminobacter sp. UC22_36]|uniref:DUF2000 family protein n=1 Tax=Aminobacter sp. UC22_36 TaxID=3374549 RepID=UPI0037567BDC